MNLLPGVLSLLLAGLAFAAPLPAVPSVDTALRKSIDSIELQTP